MTDRIVAGIDVSKDRLDVHAKGDDRGFANEKGGSGRCTDGFTGAAFGISLEPVAFDASPHVVCEATGRFHRQLLESLCAKGFTVHVVNPVRVRRFAESLGHLAKSDRIDVRTLAALRVEQGKCSNGPLKLPPPFHSEVQHFR